LKNAILHGLSLHQIILQKEEKIYYSGGTIGTSKMIYKNKVAVDNLYCPLNKNHIYLFYLLNKMRVLWIEIF